MWFSGETPGSARPRFDVIPVPARSATHGPPRGREQPALPPHVRRAVLHPQAVSDLDQSNGVTWAHGYDCTHPWHKASHRCAYNGYMASLEDRFWSKVSVGPTGECWLWTAALDRDGYGRFSIQRKERRAHRIAYELAVGTIPDGLVVDHLCRVVACCNPAHLEVVTSPENTRRGFTFRRENGLLLAAQRPECANGHKYEEGSYLMRRGKYRVCKACNRDRQIRWKQRQQESA